MTDSRSWAQQDTDMSSLIFWGSYEDEQDRDIDDEVDSEPYHPTPDELVATTDKGKQGT